VQPLWAESKGHFKFKKKIMPNIFELLKTHTIMNCLKVRVSVKSEHCD